VLAQPLLQKLEMKFSIDFFKGLLNYELTVSKYRKTYC